MKHLFIGLTILCISGCALTPEQRESRIRAIVTAACITAHSLEESEGVETARLICEAARQGVASGDPAAHPTAEDL